MVATLFLAVAIASQTAKKPDLDDKVLALATDLRQSLTLLDSLKAKVANEKDAAKLLTQFSEKMESIGQTADKYLLQAKTDDTKVKLSLIRFEALSNTNRSIQQIETLANDILAKYKESAALCPAIEDLTFYQYLTPDRYSSFDTMLKQSKNEEVLASANLASYFIQFFNDAGDVNKFKILSQKYPKTKAGQRAARIFDYRTKLILGQPMLDLEIELLTGYKLNVNSLKGKVVVVNFWGFWCPACLEEMSEVKDYVSKYPTRLAWVGVNTDNWTSAYVNQRMKDSGITWPNSAAGSPTGRLPMDLGITNYPSKIIIDSFGIVKYLPSSRDWRPVLEEALEKA